MSESGDALRLGHKRPLSRAFDDPSIAQGRAFSNGDEHGRRLSLSQHGSPSYNGGTEGSLGRRSPVDRRSPPGSIAQAQPWPRSATPRDLGPPYEPSTYARSPSVNGGPGLPAQQPSLHSFHSHESTGSSASSSLVHVTTAPTSHAGTPSSASPALAGSINGNHRPGPQARQRTAVACRYCRKRKIRCTGISQVAGDPRCSNCRRLDQECIYAPVSAPVHGTYLRPALGGAQSVEGYGSPGSVHEAIVSGPPMSQSPTSHAWPASGAGYTPRYGYGELPITTTQTATSVPAAVAAAPAPRPFLQPFGSATPYAATAEPANHDAFTSAPPRHPYQILNQPYQPPSLTTADVHENIPGHRYGEYNDSMSRPHVSAAGEATHVTPYHQAAVAPIAEHRPLAALKTMPSAMPPTGGMPSLASMTGNLPISSGVQARSQHDHSMLALLNPLKSSVAAVGVPLLGNPHAALRTSPTGGAPARPVSGITLPSAASLLGGLPSASQQASPPSGSSRTGPLPVIVPM